jgi:serine/threonine protein kinase
MLKAFGLPHSSDDYWLRVGKVTRTQGWKLHVSSVPTQAETCLRAVLPVLQERRVPFKIAKNEDVLERLNCGRLGSTQVGKFITIYPDPENRDTLANQLSQQTMGLSGPMIPTDYRIGDVLFTRYGAFAPIIVRDRLGQPRRKIRGKDGTLIEDTYESPGVAETLEKFSYLMQHSRSPEGNQIAAGEMLGRRYLPLRSLKRNAKGDVWLAIDVASQETVAARIIKQGKQWCLSDRYGRDARSRLQRELEIYRSLSGCSGLATALEYFEVKGDGFLIVDYVDGVGLEEVAYGFLAHRPFAALDLESKQGLLSLMNSLIENVQEIHNAGFVHRDLSTNNIMVTRNGKAILLDFEMAQRIDDNKPCVGLGTVGFSAPEQLAGGSASLADDVFSIGCVLTLMLTGIDPRRLLFLDAENRQGGLANLCGNDDVLTCLINAVQSAMRPTGIERCQLASLRDAVGEANSKLQCVGSREKEASLKSLSVGPLSADEIGHLLKASIRGLFDKTVCDHGGLWLSFPVGTEDETGDGTDRKLLRSAHKGVAGVLYVLARLAHSGYADGKVRSHASRAIDWLLGDEVCPDSGMPGLHFGDAGVAVAIGEAIRAGLVEENDGIWERLHTWLSGPLDWLDLTHGAAGQGLAALIYHSEFAPRCALFLIEAQKSNGAWEIPAGFRDLSGQEITGFAHGVAGIIYFLAEYAHRTGDEDAERAWRRGAEWLLKQSITSQSGLIEWPYSTTQTARWKWWCHGGPGIALTFFKLHAVAGERKYLEVGLNALRIHPKNVRHGNLTQCHGLSGLGEIYIEAYRSSGSDEWLERAWDIGRVLRATARHLPSGGCTWFAGNPGVATADLYVGSAGIVHFLLRLSSVGKDLGFPLLPEAKSSGEQEIAA